MTRSRAWGATPKIRLNDHTLDRIEPLAAAAGITVSRWVRQVVEEALRREGA